MPKTLSIGGATYDVFVRMGKEFIKDDAAGLALAFPLGDKIRVENVVESCGGGACNTAVGLARLGCTSHFCGILGSDQWGERLLENFRKEHVDARCVTIVENETSSFSIILSAGGSDRVILYEPGTNSHLHDANFDREKAGEMQWLYLNHLHERGSIIEDDLLKILRENSTIGLTWNPGGPQLKKGLDDAANLALLAETDLLLLNKEEALMLSKMTSMDAAIRCFLDLGARNVCISDGKRGSIGANAEGKWRCPVQADAPIVETTGAGDAFGTGATWALLNGLHLKDALKAGTINAASVIGAIGAQAGLLTDTEMHKRLTHVRLDVEEC